jgi:hypothetical protein
MARRASEWPDGAYSIPRLPLRSKGEGTRPIVDYVGIPDPFRDGVADGWKQFDWKPMKAFSDAA